MVKSCLSTWNDEETRSKCENYTETVRQEPTLGLPVTSNATNITYVNYHCAKCNDDFDINKTIRWHLAVTCGKDFAHPLPELNTNMKLKYENSKFKPTFQNMNYSKCQLYIWRPFSLLRKCHLNTVVTCPTSWLNETVRAQCEEYTSLVFNLLKKPFRNPHCATCNSLPVREWRCEKKTTEVETGFPEMFDFNGCGDEVGRRSICPNFNEDYDILTNKCRIINVPETRLNEGRMLGNCSETRFLCDPKKRSYFTLRREQYKLNSNCTVEVFPLYKVYSEGQYREAENDSLEMCVELPTDGMKFGDILRLLAILGHAVSIVFLFLHLVAFTKNPALRNISDKNLASYCTALLLAFGASIIGLLLNTGSTLFQLHSFSAKNICGYTFTYTVEIGHNVMKKTEYFVLLQRVLF